MVASMSLLDRLRPDHVDTAREPVGAVGAALSGAGAALLSLLGVALPVLLTWAVSPDTAATWGQAVRVSADGWLLLHHVELVVPGGSVSLPPLGLTVAPALACWWAGRRIAAGHLDDDLVPGVRRGAAPSPRALAVPVAAMAVGYALVLTAVALLARGDGVRPVAWQAPVAGLVLALGAGGAAALRHGRPSPAAAVAEAVRLPARLRRCARPAAMASTSLVALGALAVAGALLVHHDRVLSLHRALDPGVVGGAVLTVAEVGVLPNLVLFAVAWLAGPGFAVGVATSVTPAGSTLGLLPLVPLLGAVPATGALPALTWAVVALPVLVGAGAGWVVARRRPTEASRLDVVADGLTCAALTAAALAAALAVAGGAAGPGALATVGASGWKVGLVLAAELAAGAGASAWATHRRRAARPR